MRHDMYHDDDHYATLLCTVPVDVESKIKPDYVRFDFN